MFKRSDEALIKQALKGSKSAWEGLVKRYESGIYNYAYRMVNHPDDAMDLMQDIFIAVFRNLSSFRGDSPFKGWLFKIAHYRCIEYYRKKKPLQSIDDTPEQEDESEESCPEYDLTQGQENKALHLAMQRLPFNQKLMVEMKFFQHFTFEDIANQLGISTNTAKSRLYSALDKLKDYLEVEDVAA
ncbi:sigma-70 family RNA polymerase sigma factor [Thalassotalea sp. M1531]|uniref:Sigma-70 family RNA polymerase sigma factor n=1 Tax=Thalassotalea algicola TaxID=2716224 RepID=A0A7Y0LC80_9GAMM|nr:sigma-70 family RNA polymerase sigma factor [Thalassotalea algicola]NMP31006.1 sigma-70 family RNA polymerase sigma factor [Thalassotalea algicola]